MTLIFLLPALCLAWDPPLVTEWQSITPNLNAALTGAGLTAMTGNNAGIAVDRLSGFVFATPSGNGVWRSRDNGQTFIRVSTVINNSPSLSWMTACLSTSAEGGKVSVFNMDPGTNGFSTDTGNTWHAFGTFIDPATGSSMRGWDAGALNWQGNSKYVLGMTHEGAGLYYSGDSGATWRLSKTLGSDNLAVGCGVFDSLTVVATENNGLTIRSTDAGMTWSDVGNNGFVGSLQFFKNKPYWLSNYGVMTTTDKGAAWDFVGSISMWTPIQGPFFGKDENHMVVATAEGIMESRDGGNNWYLLAPIPMGFRPLQSHAGGLFWYFIHNFGYDPVNDILYAQQLAGDGGIFKLILGRDSVKSGLSKAAVTMPQQPKLLNAPNPFKVCTRITVSGLPAGSGSSVRIYDLNGRRVAELSGAHFPGGAIWDASGHPSGIYQARIAVNGRTLVRQILLTR